MILIQHIETSWLKNERGGRAGTRRGKTPAALPVPTGYNVGGTKNTVLHRVRFGRVTAAPEPEFSELPAEKVAVGCVLVNPAGEGVTVATAWTSQCGGKPMRWQTGLEPWQAWLDREWLISQGQWCQIRYNGRIDLDHTWLYHITTVNVGVFDQLRSEAFLSEAPSFRREDLVRLV